MGTPSPKIEALELEARLRRALQDLDETRASLRRHTTRITALYQLGRDISSTENWSDALDRFLMALTGFLEAEGAGLLLYSHESSVLRPRASFGIEPPVLEATCGTLLECFDPSRGPNEIHSLEAYGPTGDPEPCSASRRPWRTTLVPLRHRGEGLGILVLRKPYETSRDYLPDSPFLTMLQTILAQEVASAAYISRLRNLSRFNQSVLESISNGVLATDRDGRIEYANQRAFDLLGDVTGREFDQVLRPLDGGPSLLQSLLEEKDPIHPVECLAGPDDRPFEVRVSASRFFRDEYHGTTLVAVLEDLRERRAWEEQLRRSDRLASLGELSAGVAHEIRNPLTGMTTAAQVLQGKLAAELKERKYVDLILEEIQRLENIVRDMLRFARPTPLRVERVSLGEIAAEAIRHSGSAARAKGVSLACDSRLDPDLTLADPGQLCQVLVNLIQNAVDASPRAGSVNVTVEEGVGPPSPGTQTGGFVRLRVTDTGAGIPHEHLDRLFNPFFTTKPEGTGLGLSICQKIVEEHGGIIRVESEPGRGTSVMVDVPRRMRAVSLGRGGAAS
jgi:signal transduction histidine kinase